MKRKNQLTPIEKLWKCFNNPFLYNFIGNITFEDLDKLENEIEALRIMRKIFDDGYVLDMAHSRVDSKDLNILKKILK